MQSAEQKGYKGAGMTGRTARWYARTRQNEMEDFRRQARNVAKRLRSGCDVLEVAPGPGYFAAELAKLGDFRITGLDISETFVEIATEHAKKEGVKIDFRLGNASAMPFADESFDFVYCSAAFKNFTEPVKALDEMHRVLRGGGEAIIQDLRKDVSVEEINSYVEQSGRKRFDAWLTKMAFRFMLIKRAYTREDFARMARQSRFGASEMEATSIAFEVRLKKSAAATASNL
ncbi:MAG: class I SAM-dependent methyltransferase [Candidatus Acidiferrum sp.]